MNCEFVDLGHNYAHVFQSILIKALVLDSERRIETDSHAGASYALAE